MEQQKYDHLINWPEFYRQYIHTPISPAGRDKMNACCPFHAEKNPSFWFNTTNGLFKCEGCGVGGNATTFLSRLENISTKEAYKKLLELAGVKSDAPKPELKYTVKEYALEKRFTEEFLAGIGVKDGYKQHFVEIPYMDEDGKEIARRMRMPPGTSPRFKWRKGSKQNMYGLWRMDKIQNAGYVVLAEGESDTQTLWVMGVAALGVPGATTFRTEHAQKLVDIPQIYVHVDPDDAGREFFRRVCDALREVGYTGELRSFSCSAHKGLKDPSSLYIAEGDKAKGILWSIARAAEPIDLNAIELHALPGLEDAPVKLRIPPGYMVTEAGIFQHNPKTGTMDTVPFCWTPMLITQTLVGELGDVKLEIAYRKGGRWRTARYPRTTLATSRAITALSEYGIDVTSENAASTVRWMSALERINTDLIPSTRRASRYGWLDDKTFMPLAADGYDFDVDPAMAGYAVVGKARGNFDVWRDGMRPHRERSLFRFIMAAGFAAPLLRILGQRIFMVYNWGDSKGGKTAAMMAALSAWGNPENMRMSFNTTPVGIERIVSFFGDLPLGLNERQLAGSKQEYIEKLVYMLSEGKGRLRGSKDGGLQQQSTWRSVILANGEVELVMNATATGVSTRALELYGKPFPSEEDAVATYDLVDANHGHAGALFVKHIIATEPDRIRAIFNTFKAYLVRNCPENSHSHAASVAVVATADQIASMLIWGENEEHAHYNALGMATEIMSMLGTTDEDDMNAKAYQFLVDWVVSNKRQFSDNYSGQRFGDICNDSDVFIFPTTMRDALEQAGYSYNKTIKWLAENEKIEARPRSDSPGTQCTVPHRVNGSLIRMVHLTDLDQLPF